MKKISLCILFFMFVNVFASSPTMVTYDKRVEFERGTPKNVSIMEDGTIKPAPAKATLMQTNYPFVWDIASDKKGTLYCSAGNKGKIYQISNGDTSLFYQSEKMVIYCLAVDSKGHVYAGTSPDGNIVKISAQGSSIFYDPSATYIWDLEFDDRDNLYAATGNTAQVLKIDASGSAKVIFTSDEQQHIRALAIKGDTIYAGSSGEGYVYQFEDGKEPFVVYDTKMEEVLDLFVTDENVIYAAAMDEAIMPFAGRAMETSQAATNGSTNDSNDGQTQDQKSVQAALFDRLASVPTSLFRISQDGYAKDLWGGKDDVIQSIAPYNGDVIVGCGGNGKIYRVSPQGDLSLLYKLDETHVTALYSKKPDRLVIGTSNLATVYQLEKDNAKNAVYESDAIDSGISAEWGTLDWDGNASSPDVTFQTRSGNTEQPGKTWSKWSSIDKDGNVWRIQSPPARFVQWKVEFNEPDASLKKVKLSYLQKNLAPRISTIYIHSPGVYYPDQDKDKDKKGLVMPKSLSNKKEQQGYRSVEWIFNDPNYDGVQFSVYFQRQGNEHWREMATEYQSNVYSWDTRFMADGKYRVKVIASDSPVNPEHRALTGEKISDPFIIDNTAPVVKDVNRTDSAIFFTVQDEWHHIKSVHYSIDAKDWKEIYPKDGIVDSKIELFELRAERQHQVAIRAKDAIDNVHVFHVNGE